MTSLTNEYERLKKIPEELGLNLALLLPEEDPSLPKKKRTLMVLEPETCIAGLYCNREIPEGVAFVKDLVIKDLEHELFFIDAFSEPAF
ncbi:hypothetical protein Tco_1468974 [Tanacetum coccineum]